MSTVSPRAKSRTTGLSWLALGCVVLACGACGITDMLEVTCNGATWAWASLACPF
jgi:hypothetical protein